MTHNCKNTLCDTSHEEDSIDTGFTDKTIPIECGECNVEIIGVDAIASHLVDFHPSYSLSEVTATTHLWAEDAYEKAEEDYIHNQEAAMEDRDD